MKKTFFLLMVSLFAVAAFAQTGMFDLSYGQNIEDAHKALLAKGFKVVEQLAPTTEYSNKSVPNLISLKVRDAEDNGTISGWTIKYQVDGDQDKIDKFVTDLDALQGVTSYYDDWFGEWVWVLDNYNAIYMSLSLEEVFLTIDYTVYDDSADYYDWW
ncbi:MAG: hypothetical protein PHY48_07055 [Candidatus Cloacimonetes bacterium]|nr:hypothetical protein [Candidatus Cloacimonadota bacterium]